MIFIALVTWIVINYVFITPKIHQTSRTIRTEYLKTFNVYDCEVEKLKKSAQHFGPCPKTSGETGNGAVKEDGTKREII